MSDWQLDIQMINPRHDPNCIFFLNHCPQASKNFENGLGPVKFESNLSYRASKN